MILRVSMAPGGRLTLSTSLSIVIREDSINTGLLEVHGGLP
jgi:hypothetical protein